MPLRYCFNEAAGGSRRKRAADAGDARIGHLSASMRPPGEAGGNLEAERDSAKSERVLQ